MVGIPYGTDYREAEDGGIEILGRKDNHARAQRRIRYGQQEGRVEIQGQVHELGIALAVGEFVHVAAGDGVQFPDHHAGVL